MKHAHQSVLQRKSPVAVGPVSAMPTSPGKEATTETQLAVALARIEQLEQRLEVLEGALSVDASGNVELRSEGQLVLYGDQGASLASGIRVEVERVGGSIIELGVDVDLSGNILTTQFAMLDVSAANSKFAGLIDCHTIVAKNVVGASYSPGAGNIW